MRCREIVPADRTEVVDLLTDGFGRERAYWQKAWSRLETRMVPEGLPRFGFVLQQDSRLVGVLLLICATATTADGRSQVRCNVSSWYVEPKFRAFAPILSQRATGLKGVTYFNVTPAPHTWPILERQGFRPYAQGRMIAMPTMGFSKSQKSRLAKIDIIDKKTIGGQRNTIPQVDDLLRDHAEYGCLSLRCDAYPFVFRQCRRYGVPFARLLYCADVASFVRFAEPLGRFLLRHGSPLMIIDCDRPLDGVAGHYLGNRPRFSKGEPSMATGDLAYSELALFD